MPQQVRRQEWKSAGSGSGASAFFTHGWHWHWSLVIRIGQWPLYTGVVVGFALLMIDLLQPVLPFLSKTLCCYHHHAVILFVNVLAVQVLLLRHGPAHVHQNYKQLKLCLLVQVILIE